MHAQFLFPFYLRCISFESCGFLFHLIHAAALLVATVAVAQRLLSRFATLPLFPHLHKGKLSLALMWRNQIIHGISRTILKKKKFLLFVMRECIAAPLCLLNWSIEYFAFFFLLHLNGITFSGGFCHHLTYIYTQNENPPPSESGWRECGRQKKCK